MKKAFIFPGQGSQYIGMGKEIYDNFSASRQVYEEFSDSINYDIKKLIFSGSIEELTLTYNTQVCLAAVSIAAVRALEYKTGKKAYELCDFMAGHSLGEYSALCASESINIKDTAKILRLRGLVMQNACPQGFGAMAAVIGIAITNLEELLSKLSDEEGKCEIANDNSDSQIVISGKSSSIDKAISLIKAEGFKAIKLNVSAPFHSAHMSNAAEELWDGLQEITINTPKVSFIANVSANIIQEPELIRKSLKEQVAGRVRWRETINCLINSDVEQIVEVGAGKILSGLLKKSSYKASVSNIDLLEDLNNFIV